MCEGPGGWANLAPNLPCQHKVGRFMTKFYFYQFQAPNLLLLEDPIQAVVSLCSSQWLLLCKIVCQSVSRDDSLGLLFAKSPFSSLEEVGKTWECFFGVSFSPWDHSVIIVVGLEINTVRVV